MTRTLCDHQRSHPSHPSQSNGGIRAILSTRSVLRSVLLRGKRKESFLKSYRIPSRRQRGVRFYVKGGDFTNPNIPSTYTQEGLTTMSVPRSWLAFRCEEETNVKRLEQRDRQDEFQHLALGEEEDSFLIHCFRRDMSLPSNTIVSVGKKPPIGNRSDGLAHEINLFSV